MCVCEVNMLTYDVAFPFYELISYSGEGEPDGYSTDSELEQRVLCNAYRTFSKL